ncbi:hypothetical protein XENOCAPTIV_010690 [Xenoophorus captivus]|uniref:Uncharacterized protein n=1 Tax=Xenoophorus captivus TaxID=1517983 RepID=A0ABV0R8E2_9TELE
MRPADKSQEWKKSVSTLKVDGRRLSCTDRSRSSSHIVSAYNVTKVFEFLMTASRASDLETKAASDKKEKRRPLSDKDRSVGLNYSISITNRIINHAGPRVLMDSGLRGVKRLSIFR